MVAPQLLAEEHRRKNGSAALGVGLEVSDPLSVCGKTQQPQNQCGQRSDEQQGFGTLGALCSGVTQRESEAVVLEVANGLLDLHTLRVDALDPGAGPAHHDRRAPGTAGTSTDDGATDISSRCGARAAWPVGTAN